MLAIPQPLRNALQRQRCGVGATGNNDVLIAQAHQRGFRAISGDRDHAGVGTLAGNGRHGYALRVL